MTPCGKVMDLIRSCYKGKMRFRETDDPVDVTWFFASKDADVFTGPAIFRSADWEATPYSNSGLGEQRPPRGAWRNGQRPALLNRRQPGSHFPQEWWENGVPPSAVVSFGRLPTGEPLICIHGQTGLRFGGVAVIRRGLWPGFGGGVA